MAGIFFKSTKLMLAYVLTLALLICACLTATSCGKSEADETAAEQNDLLAMYDADLTAQVEVKNNPTLTADYWFDVTNFDLLPISSDKPDAYGEGTTQAGNGKSAFEQKYNLSYDYDERADYRDKIIEVHIKDGVIEVCWISR